MTIDLAQFKNAEAWEYGDACRQAYWSRFGTTTDAAFFGPTNGALSPWPGRAENFCPVFLPDSTIIATSGLSSPWDPDGWDEDGGDTGSTTSTPPAWPARAWRRSVRAGSSP